MALIKKQDIEKLLNVQNGLCISIYIPTHRAGHETLSGQDHILFKNKIKEAKELLSRHGLTESEIETYIKPAEQLSDDNNFWRHQAEGLAVFITKGFSAHYSLPVAMPERVYVLDQFYFTPILPILSQNGRFFILNLYREKVTFYEATIDRVRQIDVSAMIPESMNEALKFDIKGNDQDFNNSRSTTNGSNLIMSAQGTNKSDEQHERVREFMIEIDNNLQEILHNATEPLVLAGVDHYCGIYRNISKYKHIVQDNVNVNEGVDNAKDLHEKALSIIKPLMEKSQKEHMERYQNVAGTGVTSEDIATVAAEAIHGRVDTLFIAPGEPVWGTYDTVKATAEVHENYRRGDDDLINLAAIKTIAQGGTVIMSNDRNGTDASSNGNSNVKALFRY